MHLELRAVPRVHGGGVHPEQPEPALGESGRGRGCRVRANRAGSVRRRCNDRCAAAAARRRPVAASSASSESGPAGASLTSMTRASPRNASRGSASEAGQPSCTWSGASACVPTCGLPPMCDRLTLAPSAMRVVHPHSNGASPGHSGVPTRTSTEMSCSTLARRAVELGAHGPEARGRTSGRSCARGTSRRGCRRSRR